MKAIADKFRVYAGLNLLVGFGCWLTAGAALLAADFDSYWWLLGLASANLLIAWMQMSRAEATDRGQV